MAEYTRIILNEELVSIKKASGADIPIDEKNCHYSIYLKWLAKGNTPDETDITPVEE